MKDKVLIIKAKGGLGNCILSAVCGLVYADLTGRRAAIDWRDGSYAPIGENAYPVLFKTPIDLRCEDYDDYEGPISPAIWADHLDQTPQAMIDKFAPDKHSSATVYRRFCTDLSRLEHPEDVAVFWCYLPKFGRLAKHTKRHARFRGRPLDEIIAGYLTSYFTPNERVLEAVRSIQVQHRRPMIGVHVRYTDRKIPLEKVKSALRQRLLVQPEASVFLATDNAAVQEAMLAEFPGLFFAPKYLPSDGSRLHNPGSEVSKTVDAESALTDMWLLGQCDDLIYSRHSTFSVTSSYIGAFAKDRLVDVDRLNWRVVAKRIIQNYA